MHAVVQCVGPPDDKDPDHQVCKLFNVVVAGDEIYYITGEILSVISCFSLGSQGTDAGM